ncbi:unnamed protein product, partial [Mesorhabditis belari]|uniref:Uncharacterized protein n=1 Tax=Mesorhabditis belari TaxID=2138241 RepID=A0AAF3FH55_9BILA
MEETANEIIVVLDSKFSLALWLSQIAEPGSTSKLLILKNKYYQRKVDVQNFQRADSLRTWYLQSTPRPRIGAIVIKYDVNDDPFLVEELIRGIQFYKAEAALLVVDSTFYDDDPNCKKVEQLTLENRIEIIQLDPSDEMRKELIEEYGEKVGIERLFEALQSVQWTTRKDSSGNRKVDEIFAIAKAMPPDDLGCNYLNPNSEDEECIWRAFNMNFDIARTSSLENDLLAKSAAQKTNVDAASNSREKLSSEALIPEEKLRRIMSSARDGKMNAQLDYNLDQIKHSIGIYARDSKEEAEWLENFSLILAARTCHEEEFGGWVKFDENSTSKRIFTKDGPKLD